MSTQHALQAGLAQMSLCIEAQDNREPFWSLEAYAFLQRFVNAQPKGKPFSAEAVTVAARDAGIKAKDNRAWGATFLRAQREGLIRRSNTMIRRAFGHGAYGPAWERA